MATINTKSCPTCKHKVLKPYFKNHVCPRDSEGDIIVWKAWAPGRVKGRKKA